MYLGVGHVIRVRILTFNIIGIVMHRRMLLRVRIGRTLVCRVKMGIEGTVWYGAWWRRAKLEDGRRTVWIHGRGHLSRRGRGEYLRSGSIWGSCSRSRLLLWSSWLKLITGSWGGRGDGSHIDSLANEEVVNLIQVEIGEMALEERLALRELELDAFGITSWGEGLSMAVLLVTSRSRGCASSAFRMLGIALRGPEKNQRL